MAEVIERQVGGETMRLDSERALFWPARARLIVADVHLGKGDAMREAGISVPSGGSAHDLARLDALIARHQARALWILGDLLHGGRIDSHWRKQWLDFRHRHADLEMLLVAGNHDRAAARAGLGIDIHPGELRERGLLFAHAPAGEHDERIDADADAHRLAGHLHPVVKLPGIGGRHPAFALAAGQSVLPAFSAFTGGWLMKPGDAELLACVNGHLLPIASRRAGASR